MDDDLKNLIVLKDETVTECPACKSKLVIKANDCYMLSVPGTNKSTMAECEDEIVPLPCCGADAAFNHTGVFEG